MEFENLRVNRIAVHEVFQRREDRNPIEPVYGDALEQLEPAAMGAFRLRMIEALSGQTQSLRMRIVAHGPGSYLDVANQLIGSNDQDFLECSKLVADKLAEAQQARRIPGGMVIVFDGTAGATNMPFVGVIKAETQQGFRRSRVGERAVVEFLQNIFLTPATRLYKIGIMLREAPREELPEGWRAMVFDSNISSSNREAAAAYFYGTFLGCTFPSDGPYETMKFFDLTKRFIRESPLDPDEKRNVLDSLYVFVRDEQEATFTTEQFAGRYLPAPMRDAYGNFMEINHFAPGAVVRDTSLMGNRLRRRRLKFGTDIELSASPTALQEKIQMKSIETADANGQQEAWTEIIIREALTGEQ